MSATLPVWISDLIQLYLSISVIAVYYGVFMFRLEPPLNAQPKMVQHLVKAIFLGVIYGVVSFLASNDEMPWSYAIFILFSAFGWHWYAFVNFKMHKRFFEK